MLARCVCVGFAGISQVLLLFPRGLFDFHWSLYSHRGEVGHNSPEEPQTGPRLKKK